MTTNHLALLSRPLRSALLCLAVAFTLAACGGSDDKDGAAPPDNSNPSQPGEPTKPAPQLRCAP